MSQFPKPCHVSRCPELTHEQYCAEHAREKQAERSRRRRAERKAGAPTYDSARWRKFRKSYLRSVGWRCEECGDRPFDTSKMHVHHIDENPTGPNRFDHDNLEALCVSCHSSLHGVGA